MPVWRRTPAAESPAKRWQKEIWSSSRAKLRPTAKFDFIEKVRSAIREIGYTHEESLFHADTCLVVQALSRQNLEIAQVVDAKPADGKETDEQGAGDTGLMFGFAVRETPELMPVIIKTAGE